MKAKQKQVQTDPDKSLDELAEQLEKVVYDAIKSVTITIPSGQIIVATSTGPAANVQPIILQKSVS